MTNEYSIKDLHAKGKRKKKIEIKISNQSKYDTSAESFSYKPPTILREKEEEDSTPQTTV